MNCQFQNMPGSAVCGRCGSSLGLATAVLDVHPPRAGRFAKRMRRLQPPARVYRGARDAATAAGRGATVAFESLVPRFPPLPVSLRLVFPGWSHFYIGQRARGHLFLWSYLSCLLPGLLMLGTVWGSIQLGLAFSVHASAVVDIFSNGFGPGELRDRIVRGLGVTALLAVILYWPAGWLLMSVADPTLIQAKVGAFADGDVLLVNHWLAPRPGRVVLYTLPDYSPPTLQHTRIYYVGDRVDRILAGPGDEVRWADGRVWVNQRPSPWFPLNRPRITGSTQFAVPPGHFFIIPSTTLSPQGGIVPEGLWTALGIVSASNIRGSVYLRTHPLSRFGRID